MADNKTAAAEDFYKKPPKLSKWNGFKLFLWNPEHKTLLGRTIGSWAKILVFYAIFYTVLMAFFLGLYAIFYTTIDEKNPKWQLDESLIGTNPGLGFRPMPSEDHVESTLIWYKRSDSKTQKYWIDETSKFLKDYESSGSSNNRVNCTYNTTKLPHQVCSFNVDLFDVCGQKGYQYDSKTSGPCIFLKLNRIFNWVPEPVDPSALPDEMPSSLKEKIKREHESKPNMIWVSCEGENAADKESIGEINYFPFQGFPGYYYPYNKTPNYLSPLVAVYFKDLNPSTVINIECKAWAKNIIHERAKKLGLVHFELLVD